MYGFPGWWIKWNYFRLDQMQDGEYSRRTIHRGGDGGRLPPGKKKIIHFFIKFGGKFRGK